MNRNRLQRLIDRGIITREELDRVFRESESSGTCPEEIMIDSGISVHEVLLSLAGYHGCPFVEYDEGILLSRALVRRLDMQELRRLRCVPVSVSEGKAEVIAYMPDDPAVTETIRRMLNAGTITFRVALPRDIFRIMEHNQDINPCFPPAGGRTPLAMVRTFLASMRSLRACQRTALSKGRTGLSLMRTGISFITIALLLLRVFGTGYLSIIELLLFVSGTVMTADGLIWYIPVRKKAKEKISFTPPAPEQGTTVLELSNPGDNPVFSRSGPLKGAEELRASWSSLSPVMRRRFLANDRTDLADERTLLASYRTDMARARTGLAFTRTGAAFAGLGTALLRQLPGGHWIIFDVSLLLTGAAMICEGFLWYLPGRRAANSGLEAVRQMTDRECIWDFVCPPSARQNNPQVRSSSLLRKSGSAGIWATTGLALERTVLAERRNVMSRFRTIMARPRTGLSLIRTGISVFSVGLGLALYFGAVSMAWTTFNIVLMAGGLLLTADGLIWYAPAETMRKQMPYCFGDIEIHNADYGKPHTQWGKVTFNHNEI